MTHRDLWDRFRRYYCRVESLDLSLDISRVRFDDEFFERMAPAMDRAYAAMDELEAGTVADPDEGRVVGHYWLRSPELAPKPEWRRGIAAGRGPVKTLGARVYHGGPCKPVLALGMGRSALGPMFVADALGDLATDKMQVHFIDNTDPDGLERVLKGLEGKLAQTLTIVTSKSGGTPETHNGMTIVARAYCDAGLEFPKYAVAITMEGSKLDKLAESQGWLERFPMFDWIGGRTSELSAVGLLPAALQGLDINGMLAGAETCDAAT